MAGDKQAKPKLQLGVAAHITTPRASPAVHVERAAGHASPETSGEVGGERGELGRRRGIALRDATASPGEQKLVSGTSASMSGPGATAVSRPVGPGRCRPPRHRPLVHILIPIIILR
jgi:hypothetical protein